MSAPNVVSSTLTPKELASRTWDVCVIGAGPAGAMAARELARRGLVAALVDKAEFPRDKVCGGCLTPASLSALRDAGLENLPHRLGGRPISEVQFSYRHRHTTLPLRGGVSVSRRSLDAALVSAAIESGVEFVAGHLAYVGDCQPGARTVHVGGCTIAAHVILVADGLGGRALAEQGEFAVEIDPRERVGIGALIGGAGHWPVGVVHMAGIPGGYIGLVRVEDDLLDVAGALRPELVREAGGTAGVVRRIVSEAGLPALPSEAEIRWRGTPTLTRRRWPLAGERVFVLGDSAGYVEPFTGEGIGWALRSGLAVAPLVARGASKWDAGLVQEWRAAYAQCVGRRQLWCRAFRRMLWSDSLTRAALEIVSRVPALGRVLLGATHRAA